MTVKDVIAKQQYEFDGFIESLDREINFIGIGWYSLDDYGVYQPGKFATYSRIQFT